MDPVVFEDCTDEESDKILKKAFNNEKLDDVEIRKFKTQVMTFLGQQYSRLGWVMQLHIGTIRNNSKRMMRILGPDTGFDAVADYTFAEALKKAGYKEKEFGVQGRRVFTHFTKPHTAQPLTRTSFTEFIMQRNNESFCDAYNRLTEDYTDTLDKLEIVRNESPNMYKQILNMGKPKAVYDSFTGLKSYIKDNQN
jgi:hypothetical protein